ncbi:hypothetical protein [Actinospongicola halichondriae]|uniref:hypothetical protein n=1 Tax=Actinospongicola halichondriae TaxID=3236844 RepID=UPI003D595CD0
MSTLAELEIYHSRPFAPTRRIALGSSNLPVDPAPGPGGILLGAVVAQYRSELDEELFENMLKLTMQIQEGQRIVQPRLRHRFQDDRHGLTRSRARLRRDGDDLTVDLDDHGSGLQMMVGVVYAAGSLEPMARRSVMDAVRKGMRWTGPLDRRLFAHLSGLASGRDWDAAAYDDPVQWALHTLGMSAERDGSIRIPDRKAIQRRFRDALRDAHPDHGGDSDDAAVRINDLTEARRILLA